TKHQPTKAPTPPRSRQRRSAATAAQPYATRSARASQPRFRIAHDLAPSTTVSGATIVTDPGPDYNRPPTAAARSPGVGTCSPGPPRASGGGPAPHASDFSSNSTMTNGAGDSLPPAAA